MSFCMFQCARFTLKEQKDNGDSEQRLLGLPTYASMHGEELHRWPVILFKSNSDGNLNLSRKKITVEKSNSNRKYLIYDFIFF